VALVDVERVVLRGRRVPVRGVQRREVVVRVLDFGPVEDLVAEPDEDVLDLAADLRDRV